MFLQGAPWIVFRFSSSQSRRWISRQQPAERQQHGSRAVEILVCLEVFMKNTKVLSSSATSASSRYIKNGFIFFGGRLPISNIFSQSFSLIPVSVIGTYQRHPVTWNLHFFFPLFPFFFRLEKTLLCTLLMVKKLRDE